MDARHFDSLVLTLAERVASRRHVATGLFANSDPLARELIQAGEAAWDRAFGDEREPAVEDRWTDGEE